MNRNFQSKFITLNDSWGRPSLIATDDLQTNCHNHLCALFTVYQSIKSATTKRSEQKPIDVMPDSSGDTYIVVAIGTNRTLLAALFYSLILISAVSVKTVNSSSPLVKIVYSVHSALIYLSLYGE